MKKTDDVEEIKRLKMMYQSVKGARNAGSVDYNQRIILINSNGEYTPKKIGEFVDETIGIYGSRVETINGIQFEIAKVTEPWHAVSVTADGKTELKRVTKAVRHKYDGKLIKITTKRGSTVVTPNHSIFTIKNNRLSMIDAGALNKNIPIAHAENNYEKSTFQPSSSEKKGKLIDCFAIPSNKIEFVDASSEFVYDISVEENENFIDVNGGIVLHNTHGILAAPNVSGRQFNLWGACAITTKGQVILDDTLQMLKKKNIRVTYGDTDGLYLGCSRSLSKLADFAKSLGLKQARTNDVDWLTPPDEAIKAIMECNEKWQHELNYKEFELEPEYHDAMIFVKHKNYLIFDEKNGIVEMATKGNNFKGSDKANIARKALKEIMLNVLRDVSTWSDEDEARALVKDSIRNHTQKVVASLDFSKVDIDDLTLIQSVKPARSYKKNQDGGLSTFGKRAKALEQLLGEPISSRMKLRFVVTKKPLPGIQNPSKSGVKPIDFMYPVDKLSSKTEIDLEWYKAMIENYIQGAFGLSKIGETQQT
ncbi:MAG: DNA polymerase domain-containing protein, partial [Candidatus Thermoplasmatota archaeon]|nr:DNA polymerase domain-containing protein [Candidatus Thermoplasmatota archaeon]